MNNKLWYAYVLKLEDNCWYIGITVDLDRRMASHFDSSGAKWTKLHKPVKLHQTKELGYMTDGEAAKIESYITYLYVVKYGIQYVRGGFFCQVKLTDRYWSKVSRKFNRDYKNGEKSVPHPPNYPMKKKRKKSGVEIAQEQLDRSARLLGVYN